MDGTHRLRVIVANQRAARLELIAQTAKRLGHDLIARKIHVKLNLELDRTEETRQDLLEALDHAGVIATRSHPGLQSEGVPPDALPADDAPT